MGGAVGERGHRLAVAAQVSDDLAAMEASLEALGERYEGLAAELFETFIAAHPQYAHTFLNPEAARERMTRETIEALIGMAAGESWVSPTVINFVDLHRNYAAFAAHDYAAWFDLTIAAMARRAASDWPDKATEAWQRQSGRLGELVAAELAQEWAHKV
jgi:hypothetical protein